MNSDSLELLFKYLFLIQSLKKGNFENGKVDLSAGLKELARELGVEDKVIFTGASKDVNSYLLKSKIFAFTSDHEGFPNSLGEAMAAGLPVVSYDCVAGPSDMIDDGVNGYLVPVFDDELFIKRLDYLMSHEDERQQIGKAAREKIKQFDAKSICDKFACCYSLDMCFGVYGQEKMFKGN